ncbi:MAG: 23S rRNA (guanosine(2251)-2'-O)-methyltransferase RlmB [Lachnospiraceae bacterium]|nr:23S rRNA (guanosine(2251)-2'-O)-methyltransferase RlmB [Lachnospiraceae bacterium]
MPNNELLEGRHAVTEALRAGLTPEVIYLQKDLKEEQKNSVLEAAKKAGVRVRLCEKEKLDALSATGRHQGVMAELAPLPYAEVADMLAAARAKGEDPFLILLDGIEDPHNLGAVIRSAHQAGAHGVILPKNRSAGLNATVARTSAGAVHFLPVAQVINLSRTMEELKKEGLWFACADMDGQVLFQQDLKGPIGLVIGSEGAGISPNVRKHCDFVVSIPMKGQIDSLNASVAAGILMFEVVRQRSL